MSKKELENQENNETLENQETNETLENQENNETLENQENNETLENQENNETLENQETNEISEDTIIECIVLQEFKDKYTNEKYKINKKLKISYKRYKEINEKNNELVKLIER